MTPPEFAPQPTELYRRKSNLRLTKRPVDVMRREVSEFGSGDLSRRIPEPPSTTRSGDWRAAKETLISSPASHATSSRTHCATQDLGSWLNFGKPKQPQHWFSKTMALASRPKTRALFDRFARLDDSRSRHNSASHFSWDRVLPPQRMEHYAQKPYCLSLWHFGSVDAVDGPVRIQPP